MKKIIALLVVFALFAGSAFAADIGVDVHAGAALLKGSSVEDSDITTDFSLSRVRIGAAGDLADGAFGGWFRMTGTYEAAGLAWWKPLDFLKVQLSYNPDGHWGKDGNTRWMFYQMATDSPGLTDGGANSWGGGLYGWNKDAGAAFSGGGTRPLMLEITPLDILAINIGLPFDGRNVDKLFDNVLAVVDLNLAFGNIALTYEGQGEKKGKLWAYAGLPISILNLDVGVGLPFDTNDNAPKQQIWAGLGLKAGISDLFGIKFRAYAGFGGEDSDPFLLTADVLPYLTLSDTLRVFFAFGLGMASYDDSDLNKTGFNINPYIQVGSEWGPMFFAGFKLTNDGVKGLDDKTVSNWSVNIGILTSF